MLPDFDENGYLPPGAHLATVFEIQARFGTATEVRRAQFESLSWFLDSLKDVVVGRFVINGSFVTAIEEPNDVDIAILVDHTMEGILPELDVLLESLPFLHVEFLTGTDFDLFVTEVYASDRRDVSKGVVELQR